MNEPAISEKALPGDPEDQAGASVNGGVAAEAPKPELPPKEEPKPEIKLEAASSPPLDPEGAPETIPLRKEDAIELRVRRLEQTMAELGDNKQLEERIYKRVAIRLDRKRVSAEKNAPAASVPPAEPPNTVPKAAEAPPPPVARIIAPPIAAVAPPPAPPAPPRRSFTESLVPSSVRRSWAIFEALNDLRLMWRMFRDPGYRMSWLGKVVPVAILLFILVSQFIPLWGWVPLVGSLLDKALDIVLAYIAFKVLQRELAHYRETVYDR